MSFRWTSRPGRDERTRGTGGKTSERLRRSRRRPALEPLEDRQLLSTTIPLSSGQWTPVGPASISGTSGFGANGGPASGRITGVAADPNNANVIYIAAAGGGVWKTTNGGQSWLPLTDNLTDPQGNPVPLFMGAIAVAQSNSNVIYAGTGEANNSLDSFYGEGVLKSSNGGTTWTLEGKSSFFGKTISKIVVDPTNASNLYVAVSDFGSNGTPGGTGIWKSTDGGATWTDTTTSISSIDAYSDLVMNPTNPSILYAAVGTVFGSNANGVYETTDGGNTWAPAGNFPMGLGDSRISLAISASNPQTLYAAVASSTSVTQGNVTIPQYGLLALEKSTDGGKTWAPTAGKPPEFLATQGWYDNVISVSPANPNVVFAAGVVQYNNTPPNDEIIESTDGGNSWFDISTATNGAEPHTDFHAMAFDASNRLLVGNDGGIWRLNNAAQNSIAWADLNANLQITQFTGIALDPTNANIIYGGSQDNGTEKFNGNLVWTQVFGGDGGFVQVDPTNPQTVYTENFGVSLVRSDDGGNTWTPVVTGINASDPSNFYIPYILDPSNSSHLLLGTNTLYTSNNRGQTWTALTTPKNKTTGAVTNGWNSADPINSIAIAPSNSNIIYADTSGGQLFVSVDGGVHWTEHDVQGANNGLQQIIVNPTNPNVAYVVRGAFDSGSSTGHVFVTINGGATWTNITGTLPDTPTWSIALDSRPGSGRLYVGTDVGVYMSSDGGTTWNPYMTGLPNVQVVGLVLDTNLNVLAAATHGRGVFEIEPSASINVIPQSLNPVEGEPLGPNTLIATFTDSAGVEPIGNYTATIAWGDGAVTANATIVDEGNGVFGIEGNHTYADEGSAPITITVTDTDGTTGQDTFNVAVTDAPLNPGLATTTFSATEGQPASGVVATFVDGNTGASASDFAATINWGDGTTTIGRVASLGNGQFTVSGSHTYSEELDVNPPLSDGYPIAVQVVDIGGQSVNLNSVGAVADAPLTGTPRTLHAIEGASFTGTLASFTDGDPNGTVSDYTVIVDWGDGTSSTNAVSPGNPTPDLEILNRGTRFDVVDLTGHTYAEEGTYPITVTVIDNPTTFAPNSGVVLIASSVIVADATLSGISTSNNAVEGQPFSGAVAVFADGNVNAPLSDFSTTTIDWGDGTTSTATVTIQGAGKFNVVGAHTYAEEGSYTVKAKVTDKGGAIATLTGQMTVSDAALAAQGTTVSGVEGQTIWGLVANFSDFNLAALGSDFTPTIDWGDGTTTVGQVAQVGPGSFTVSGSHIYASAQTYTATITIADAGGSSAAATTTAVISDAPLTAQASAVPVLVEGEDYTNTIATFTDANTAAVAGNFVASIDWGDNTSSVGIVTKAAGGGGLFTVASGSPHIYSEEGNYTATVSIVDLGGARTSVQIPIAVADAPIMNAGGVPGGFRAMEGSLFNGLVSTFTESPAAPITDFSATIAWGDGHTSAGTISSLGNGVFGVSGANTYAEDGTYNALVTISDVGGSTAAIPALGVVADAPLVAVALPNATPTQGTPYTGVIAAFVDGNPLAPASDFTVLINWGDGSPASLGTVTAAGNGIFTVSGDHAYAAAGELPFSVTIFDKGSSIAATSGTASVLFPLVAASVTNPGGGITNNPNQVFAGHAQPGEDIAIQAHSSTNPNTVIVLGKTTSDSSGNWAIVSTPIPDGIYAITASMTEFTGEVLQSVNLGGLVVDTTGPQVVSTSLSPAQGQVHVVLEDATSGLNPAGAFNAANYTLDYLSRGVPVPLAATGLSATPGAPGTGQIDVTLSYNFGRRPKAGAYVLTINAAGVTDNAGNPLVEHTFVMFPGVGNGAVNNYVAQFTVSSNRSASGPQLYIPLAEQVAASNFSRFTRKHTKFGG